MGKELECFSRHVNYQRIGLVQDKLVVHSISIYCTFSTKMLALNFNAAHAFFENIIGPVVQDQRFGLHKHC